MSRPSYNALDETLPEYQPEQTIRWEFHYGGAVHDEPPWKGDSTYDGAKQYNETYLRGMKNRLDEQLAEEYPDEYANDPAFYGSSESDLSLRTASDALFDLCASVLDTKKGDPVDRPCTHFPVCPIP